MSTRLKESNYWLLLRVSKSIDHLNEKIVIFDVENCQLKVAIKPKCLFVLLTGRSSQMALHGPIKQISTLPMVDSAKSCEDIC